MYKFDLRQTEEDITLIDIVYAINNVNKPLNERPESINHLNEEIYTNQA
jgi:hypothetical protein